MSNLFINFDIGQEIQKLPPECSNEPGGLFAYLEQRGRRRLVAAELSQRALDNLGILNAWTAGSNGTSIAVDALGAGAAISNRMCSARNRPEPHNCLADWHFGLKAHIGVDSASGAVHTVIGTAGNVSDVTQAHALLHGDEVAAMGEAGYQGVENREENLGKSVT